MIEVRVGFRTRAAHGTTFGIPYPAPAAPSLALCARLMLSMPLSPSSLPLSALASTGRSNSRGNPPSLLPPSTPVLWPSPAPRVFVPPRPPSPTFPGPWVLGPLSPCPRPRCTLPAYTPRGNTRHLTLSLFTLPPPGALASMLVARMPHRILLRPLSLFVPCPVTPLPLAGHCVGRSHACRRHAPGSRYTSLRRTLHSWGWTALRQRAAALRLAQCPRALRAVRSVVGHLCASAPRSLLHAAVARPLSCPAFSALCPPASACTMWGNSRCSAPSLLPLSALAPWPCPAPCLLALPRPHVPPFPGPLVPGSRRLCPRPPFTLSAYISRSNTRGTPPTPPSPCRSHAPWFRPLQPAACGPLLPPYLPLPPLPFSLSTLTFLHYAGHFVGKSQARRRHAPGPSLPALPLPLSSLRCTLRRAPCRHVARTSQART